MAQKEFHPLLGITDLKYSLCNCDEALAGAAYYKGYCFAGNCTDDTEGGGIDGALCGPGINREFAVFDLWRFPVHPIVLLAADSGNPIFGATFRARPAHAGRQVFYFYCDHGRNMRCHRKHIVVANVEWQDAGDGGSHGLQFCDRQVLDADHDGYVVGGGIQLCGI